MRKSCASPFRPIIYKVELGSAYTHSVTNPTHNCIKFCSQIYPKSPPNKHGQRIFSRRLLGTLFFFVFYVENAIFWLQDGPRKFTNSYLNPLYSGVRPQVPPWRPLEGPGIRPQPPKDPPGSSREAFQSLPRQPKSLKKPSKRAPTTPSKIGPQNRSSKIGPDDDHDDDDC